MTSLAESVKYGDNVWDISEKSNQNEN